MIPVVVYYAGKDITAAMPSKGRHSTALKDSAVRSSGERISGTFQHEFLMLIPLPGSLSSADLSYSLSWRCVSGSAFDGTASVSTTGTRYHNRQRRTTNGHFFGDNVHSMLPVMLSSAAIKRRYIAFGGTKVLIHY